MLQREEHLYLVYLHVYSLDYYLPWELEEVVELGLVALLRFFLLHYLFLLSSGEMLLQGERSHLAWTHAIHLMMMEEAVVVVVLLKVVVMVAQVLWKMMKHHQMEAEVVEAEVVEENYHLEVAVAVAVNHYLLEGDSSLLLYSSFSQMTCYVTPFSPVVAVVQHQESTQVRLFNINDQ